ncbi:15613_t:CDS:1, partial [Acaulospora colombiana]
NADILDVSDGYYSAIRDMDKNEKRDGLTKPDPRTGAHHRFPISSI